jgi:hypothetical protein
VDARGLGLDDLGIEASPIALADAALLVPQSQAEVECGEAHITCSLLADTISGANRQGGRGQRKQAQVGVQPLNPADVCGCCKRHNGERRQRCTGVGLC